MFFFSFIFGMEKIYKRKGFLFFFFLVILTTHKIDNINMKRIFKNNKFLVQSHRIDGIIEVKIELTEFSLFF